MLCFWTFQQAASTWSVPAVWLIHVRQVLAQAGRGALPPVPQSLQLCGRLAVEVLLVVQSLISYMAQDHWNVNTCA